MKIKYRHVSAPKIEKIHDTEKAYKNMEWARNDPETKLYNKTQEEFDKIYLEIFERDKARGIVLHYEIIKEDAKQ